MSFVGRGAAAGILTASLAACVLITDTSGYSNGDDAPTNDGGIDRTEIDGATNSDATSNVEASADAGDATPLQSFHDDFARPDLGDLGNGWTEKNPDAFRISAGAAVKAKTTKNYRDNIVYRPASEDRAEVEVSATFTVDDSFAFPQVFVRAQRATITTTDGYDAYIFFVADVTSATLARQRGATDEVFLTSVKWSSAVANGDRLKLTLKVSGQALLEAKVQRLEDGGVTALGSGSFADGDPARIEGTGATGFAASFDTLMVDDFEWQAASTP